MSDTLDDAASLLVQLDAGDEAGRTELRDALARVASDDVLPQAVRTILFDAMRRLDPARASADPQRALDDVRHMIEAAAARLELRDLVASAMTPAAPASIAQAPAPDSSRVAEPWPGMDSMPELAPIAPALAPIVAAPIAPVLVVPNDIADGAASASTLLPVDVDVSLLTDFIAESRELLAAAEAALLQLEIDPDDVEAVNTIFRAFHTVKGTSGFLALDAIMEFAHHAEEVLSRVRNREIRCTGGYADLALRSADMISALLDAVQGALDGQTPAFPAGYAALLRIVTNPEAAGITEGDLAVRTGVDLGPVAEGAERTARKAGERGAEPTLRVRTGRLDSLIEMVGELVIAQSMISQDEVVKSAGHHDLTRKVSHAEKIIRELQELSMAMRMVPLKAPFQKVARLVRDLASRNGKKVEFIAEGEETEIDRNMVDFLGDPLVHMVRNSVDHGIEPPAGRLAAGKRASGTVRLSAYHSGGNVVVELSDDGRGLDRAKIVSKAIEKGLIASGEGMSDRDVYELIFAPGFSTADQVTDVSGRGVGMDVVRRNIEALRGRVEIDSRPGQGTTFTVRVPLTLAIADGMLIRVGAERFIVPTTNIRVSFRPAKSNLSTVAGRGEMVMLRDEVMPMVRLHRLFSVEGAVEDPTQALLMVVGDGPQRTALLVDELLGQHQVVAKALGAGIGRVIGISGGAILGDGRVGLILDVNEVLALARHGEGAADYLNGGRAAAA